MTTLTARCEKILFPKEPTEGRQFLIVKTDAGVIKGYAAWMPQPGSRLEATGAWQVSKYNGRPEFAFNIVAPHVPTDERATLAYACELAKNCGPALAEALWEHCGAEWRDAPAGAVRGYTEERRENLLAAANSIAADGQRTRAITYLLSHNATLRMAEAAWDAWKAKTISMVESDPFVLATLPNFGFIDVDTRIRPAFGIGDDDPRRLRAACLYAVRNLAQESTLIPWSNVASRMHELVAATPKAAAAIGRELFASGQLVACAVRRSVSLRRDAEAETAIAEYAALPAIPAPIAFAPAPTDIEPDPSQLDAIDAVLHSANRIAIINGGPGTGKTTIVRLIVSRMPTASLELCAFAGKAAARLREATGMEAHTIHSMLQWQGERFARKSLAGSTVLIDEASMVDAALMAEIVRRQPERLILVGDEGQLPPVGSGQPFHDLIRFRPEIVNTLTHGHRNSGAIAEAARIIRAGKIPPPALESGGERFSFRAFRDAQSVHDEILRLADAGEIDFATDIVLTSRNGSLSSDAPIPASIATLNQAIKDMVNPSDAKPGRPTRGDRVICTKNNPDIDCWNGTVGTLDAIDIDGSYWINVDGRSVEVPRDHASDWQLAYALTVHKSQGSQYRKVFFCCLDRDIQTLLDRPLVYTALTRATTECVALGSSRAFAAAINAMRRRTTLLQAILDSRNESAL